MIPYIRQPILYIGGRPIVHAFGVMVAIAMIVGMRFTRRRAAADGLDPMMADRLVTWTLVAGFIGAHLVDRFVYKPAEALADPLSILRVWEGLSSFGGFLGAVIGTAVFFRRHLELPRWRYLDCVAYGFPFGWIFGRLGCTLAFDHPGRETSFFLGEMYTDHLVRHNLGLYEALYTVLLAAFFHRLGRQPRPPGYFVAVLPIVYAPVRFFLDFLRKGDVDVRYAGLTPAQWGCLVVIVVGVLLLKRAQKKGEAGASPSTI
ncbi:MAG TPA: prolipoprotein diacylglyceryl transferase family protein [Polyangia bacterium]|nr:prolipoprotein diacylglyceryl transferase family protein [Polyangia bacterium]